MNWSPEAYKKLAEIAAPREREPLGELAVEAGYLTIEQLEECLREQQEIPPNERPRLGEILVRKGYVRPGQLARLLEKQADETGLRDPGWRYEIRELAGRGATASVYRAWDRELRREVAIKVVRQEHMLNLEVIRRMIHEARVTARLTHPNIVPVYDVGAREGMVYFVMPFVEGRTLSDRLLDAKFGPRERIEMLAKVAEAVQHAHEKKVIHRDLKPRNVLIDGDGEPRVTDFGLARLAGSDSVQTRTGTVVGTPSYMAPEQVRGETRSLDARTDIYALGAILYEMLTGEPPHSGETAAEIYHSVLVREPELPRTKKPDVPRDLEVVCRKALQKEARARYADAGEFARDLRRFLKGEPIHARPPTLTYRLGRLVRRYPIQTAILGSSTTLTLATILVSLFLLDPMPTARPSRRHFENMHWMSAVSAHIASLKTDMRTGRVSQKVGRSEAKRILEELNRFLTREPDSYHALYLRAQVRRLLRDRSGAEIDARASTRLQPKYAMGWMLVSSILMERNRHHLIDQDPLPPSAVAIDALSTGLRAGPRAWGLRESPQDQVLRIVSQARHARLVEKNGAKALQILDGALDLYGAEEYHLLKARWMEDREKGTALLTQALERSPYCLEILVDLAVARSRAGKTGEAIALFTRAIRLDPDAAWHRANRGLLHHASGHWAQAVADLEAAIELAPDLHSHLQPKIAEARERQN